MNLKKHLKNEILIFDSAMGVALQEKGLEVGELPDVLNIKSPETVIGIHRKNVEAGGHVITTNTFGANELKLKNTKYSVEEIISSGVENAKKAIGDYDRYIALNVGPIGELLEPIGTLRFEEAYEIFKRQIIAGVESGVDLILIQTMTDLYEVKAAVLAAKENSDLPIITTMSFEKDGRTFTGCSPTSMVMVLQGLGVDALGVNCSLGPKEMEGIVDEILPISKIPIMVKANAGLPEIVDGRTSYNVGPVEFAEYAKRFVEKGVRIIGGCCGTSDEHIEEIVKTLGDVKAKEIDYKPIYGVCTPSNPVLIDGIKVIGENINPTGKDILKEALVNKNINYLVKEAIVQVEAGADILDINVGLPEIDEEEMIVEVIREIQSILDVPLQIDSTNPKVIEKALRIYNGKAIVNSVNGEDEVLESILPLVKKYGAAVVGLTLDEDGIPASGAERFKIAEKIVKRAEEYGIAREDVYIDTLTLTAAAQQEEVKQTLEALSLVKDKLGVKTLLGVSNISFGFPERELLNRTFLSAALYAGLDLPLINPLDKDMMDTIMASRVLWNEDKGGVDYLSAYENKDKIKKEIIIDGEDSDIDGGEDLFNTILRGVKEEAREKTKNLLISKEPLEIVNEYIIPALDLTGERYESGEIFLPQLIRSAETVRESFEVIKGELSQESRDEMSRGKVIIATVKGDIHDIGKNIVKVLLENYNYEVIDLGKDVAPETIVDTAVENDVGLIGLSALMTTTVKSMELTIKALREANHKSKVMVGGAVLNQDYSDMIGADYYAKDASEAVKIAEKVLGE